MYIGVSLTQALLVREHVGDNKKNNIRKYLSLEKNFCNLQRQHLCPGLNAGIFQQVLHI